MRIYLFLLIITSISYSNEIPFPESWSGFYKGTCEIIGKTHIQMSLHIKKIDSHTYHWTIVYKSDEFNEKRPYHLLSTTNPHQYILDERNSIKIRHAYYKSQNAEHLSAFFQVNKALIYATYTKRHDSMTLVMDNFNLADTSQTGGQNNIPIVNDWFMKSSQICHLNR